MTLGILVPGLLQKRQNSKFKKSTVQINFKEENELAQSLLMKEEEELVLKGDYEAINIQSFEASKDLIINDEILRIDKLSKEFRKLGSKSKDDVLRAVDNLSLSLFKNQILCLLGHNGAGKTTTIQMITGFLSKTSGSASVFGMDLFE
jgi:ABC-type uncharacterized transport system ATPase subunit